VLPAIVAIASPCGGRPRNRIKRIRFVDVPTPLSVKKGAGESTYLVVRREQGKALLVQVR
jgi:hypothetical protein